MPALRFTIALGRPSRAELLTLVGGLLLVGSAAIWVSTAAQRTPAPPDAPPDTAALAITSTPSGAAVVVDGHERGSTPATLHLSLGQHQVALSAQGAIDEPRSIALGADGLSLVVDLWRAHPTMTYLKPPLPGAMVVGAGFLDDGRLALQ